MDNRDIDIENIERQFIVSSLFVLLKALHQVQLNVDLSLQVFLAS